jgi:hypothetical protein
MRSFRWPSSSKNGFKEWSVKETMMSMPNLCQALDDVAMPGSNAHWCLEPEREPGATVGLEAGPVNMKVVGLFRIYT